VALAASTKAHAATWGAPFRIAGPESLDLVAPQLAFSPTGAAAIGFGVLDVDHPRHSQAYLAMRSAGGRLTAARRIPDAQELLDLAYDGRVLELLTGTSPSRLPCCSSADALQFNGSSFTPARRLVGGLAGPAAGSLLVASGHTLAAIATERGVWDTEAPVAANLLKARRVDRKGELPETIGTSAGAGNQTVLAWTARASQYAPGPRSILVARGTGARAPRGRSAAITAPAGHRINELALGHAAGGVTLAWVESWFDSFGAYHSQTMVVDLGHGAGRALSSATGFASGLAFAASGRGAQLLAWRECDASGNCTVNAALRGSAGGFRQAQSLGAIDASQAPAAAVSKSGTALLGWVSGGAVRAAAGRAGSGSFGAPRTLAGTRLSGNLALAFGPRGQALAAWTTTGQVVMGAVYH
jgi:hypothetical protein